MVVHWIGQAAVGAVLGELLKLAIEVIKTARSFKSSLQQLISTLLSITPKVKELIRLEQELLSITPKVKEIRRLEQERTDVPAKEFHKLFEKLEKGMKLVFKCTKVKRWDFYHKYRYSRKIMKLDAHLLRFFQMYLPLHMAQDLKHLRAHGNYLERKIDDMGETIHDMAKKIDDLVNKSVSCCCGKNIRVAD